MLYFLYLYPNCEWLCLVGCYTFKTTIRFIIFYHHICPINRITVSPCRTYLSIKERAVCLLSVISLKIFTEQGRALPQSQQKKTASQCRTHKNTLPQHNSVARCMIFTIKNCTILTYVAPFCTIPGQKNISGLQSEPADANFLFFVPQLLTKSP